MPIPHCIGKKCEAKLVLCAISEQMNLRRVPPIPSGRSLCGLFSKSLWREVSVLLVKKLLYSVGNRLLSIISIRRIKSGSRGYVPSGSCLEKVRFKHAVDSAAGPAALPAFENFKLRSTLSCCRRLSNS